jgi:hypothetical protein
VRGTTIWSRRSAVFLLVVLAIAFIAALTIKV